MCRPQVTLLVFFFIMIPPCRLGLTFFVSALLVLEVSAVYLAQTLCTLCHCLVIRMCSFAFVYCLLRLHDNTDWSSVNKCRPNISWHCCCISAVLRHPYLKITFYRSVVQAIFVQWHFGYLPLPGLLPASPQHAIHCTSQNILQPK